jgi:hypothetical protein
VAVTRGGALTSGRNGQDFRCIRRSDSTSRIRRRVPWSWSPMPRRPSPQVAAPSSEHGSERVSVEELAILEKLTRLNFSREFQRMTRALPTSRSRRVSRVRPTCRQFSSRSWGRPQRAVVRRLDPITRRDAVEFEHARRIGGAWPHARNFGRRARSARHRVAKSIQVSPTILNVDRRSLNQRRSI